MEGENRYEQQQQQPLSSNSQGEVEIKPEPDQKCPRCDSMKTKFCYFNNHKKSQPRYICKNCKRFWTQGGNVRNIQSNEGERKMKRPMDSSSSDGSATAVSSSPPPPLTIFSACGRVRRVGTLNFTRPQPVANQPQLKFVHTDINSLSLTKGFNKFLNPYMTSAQAQGGPFRPIPNGQYHQGSLGQGFAGHLKPSNHLGIVLWDPSCLNTTGASHYTEPCNANIF